MPERFLQDGVEKINRNLLSLFLSKDKLERYIIHRIERPLVELLEELLLLKHRTHPFAPLSFFSFYFTRHRRFLP